MYRWTLLKRRCVATFQRNSWDRAAAALAACFALTARPAAAQTPIPIAPETFAGSEAESYLRVLQDLGEIPLHPWSLRPFSTRELDRLANTTDAHPWSGLYSVAPDTTRGVRFHWIRPEARVLYNSAFPYGYNDGPLWAGRGLTMALQGGASVRYGPLSLVVDPIVFRAENASFPLQNNGRTGRMAFADGRYPTSIDLPQRFGSEPYQRFDWGQSTLRIDLPLVTAGVSTASQVWGPAHDFPLILGNNAPGFPHAFLGTSSPVNVWVGSVHARLVWGVLHQSDYSPVVAPDTRRFMSGIVAVFVPRGVPGLEIGGSRFFHTAWPTDGLTARNFTKPLEGFLKVGLPDTGIIDGKSDADNQLASAFARWVLPHSGLEVYGEYAREDHNWDLRDLTLEPDHDSGYMLGVQRSIRLDSMHILAIRAQVLNTRPSNLARVRNQTAFYRHFREQQGHTEIGQVLGSPAAYGGSGAVVAADYYMPRGQLSLSWMRQADRPGTVDGTTPAPVQNALGARSTLRVGIGDLSVGMIGVRESNGVEGRSGLNLNVSVGMRWSY
jgi:hypothetical protein